MNPLTRLSWLSQANNLQGALVGASSNRTQFLLRASKALNLAPAALNWADILHLGVVQANSAQITLIEDSIGLRVTFSPILDTLYCKTAAAAIGANDFQSNPAGWHPISSGSFIFAAAGTYIGFASSATSLSAEVRNGDDSNFFLDSFTVTGEPGDK